MTSTTEGPKPAPQPRRRHGRSASFFFWVTIGFLFAGTSGLVILGALRQGSGTKAEIAKIEASEKAQAGKRTQFEQMIETLPRKVQEEISANLDAALEAIFQPAFAGIDDYADFHYSFLGEYTELLGAVLLRSESALQKHVFHGFEERMREHARILDEEFVKSYTRKLGEGIAEIDDGTAGPAFHNIFKTIESDLLQRVRVTAPVASAASTVTALAMTKMASKTAAKKLGATIAKKAAAKGATKLGGVLTGAGSGAAACSWGGPAAAACGVGGALVAWVVVDHAIIKLDEYFNREEFEAQLRNDLEAQKKQVRKALEEAMTDKSKAMTQEAKRVSTGTFTAQQLAGGGPEATCRKQAELIGRYDALRGNAAQRNGKAIEDLRDDIEALAKLPALKAVTDEMLPVLNGNAAIVEVHGAVITGNLPEDLRENRDLSGIVTLNGVTRKITQFKARADEPFRVPLPISGQKLNAGTPLHVRLTLEQHRRLFTHRHFSGETEFPVDRLIADMGAESDTTHQVEHRLRLALDKDGDGTAEAGLPSDEVDLRLALRAPSLPRIVATGCPAP